MFNQLEIEFKDEEEAREVLELARFANVEKQKPLIRRAAIYCSISRAS